MNNNPGIIFAIGSNPLLVYICNVSDNARRSQNECLYEPGHLSEFVWHSEIVWAVVPGAPQTYSGAPQGCQAPPNNSHGPLVPAIRDPSYSDCWEECTYRI